MTDDENELPPNPLTELVEVMAQTREIFESMVAAGFTEWQVCRILGVMMAERGRQS